jgi:uncharacterized membrane protein
MGNKWMPLLESEPPFGWLGLSLRRAKDCPWLEEQSARPRPRIESFSDIVFGLALSIGAIALIGSPPASVSALYGDIATFAFNFIILVNVWIRYTRVMSVLPLENRRTLFLNTLLLFTVSIEPFLFNTFRVGTGLSPGADAVEQASLVLYGLDLGVMMLVMGVFTVSLADEEKKLVPASMVWNLRTEAYTWLASGAIFLLSADPVFNGLVIGGNLVRTDLWFGALLVALIRRGTAKLHEAGSK